MSTFTRGVLLQKIGFGHWNPFDTGLGAFATAAAATARSSNYASNMRHIIERAEVTAFGIPFGTATIIWELRRTVLPPFLEW